MRCHMIFQKMAKKKRPEGVAIPKEIIYALVLGVITGGWYFANKVEKHGHTLETIQEDVRETKEDVKAIGEIQSQRLRQELTDGF